MNERQRAVLGNVRSQLQTAIEDAKRNGDSEAAGLFQKHLDQLDKAEEQPQHPAHPPR